MRLIDADRLIEDYKKELEKVDFEKLSDNDKLIIVTSAKALIDFAKRQPIVETGYNQALEDFKCKWTNRINEAYKSQNTINVLCTMCNDIIEDLRKTSMEDIETEQEEYDENSDLFR